MHATGEGQAQAALWQKWFEVPVKEDDAPDCCLCGVKLCRNFCVPQVRSSEPLAAVACLPQHVKPLSTLQAEC